MFQTIKSKLNLIDVIINDTGLEFKECGEFTYDILDEREVGGAPCCGHSGAFKVKCDPDNPLDSIVKCFSCNQVSGSVIDWTAFHHKLSPLDAAYKLVKDYKIDLPTNFDPVQEIFQLAVTYYENCMRETMAKPIVKLARMSPLDYQLNVRRHSDEVLKQFHVGFSDGKLYEFLESLGYEQELLIESGLINKKTGKDFLPELCFVYPHFVANKASHWTFKDSAKKLAFQLPNKKVLNGAEFYNSDSISKFSTVIIVEGENDVLAVAGANREVGVIGTIGQISISQLNYLRTHLAGKDVVTIFDGDQAGLGYAEKVEKLRSSFKSLVHIRPPDGSDIDDMLKSGKKLEDIIAEFTTKVEAKAGYTPPRILTEGPSSGENTEGGEETVVNGEESKGSFFEKYGKYFTVKTVRDEPVFTQVSDFTIELKNIYLTEDGDRVREVIVKKDTGKVSKPILITSEVKVSLKAFRVFVARAIDADFTGTEQNLSAMWNFIYRKAPEVLINVTRVVGRNEIHSSWILQNCMVIDTGEVILPDDSGVFWTGDKTEGVAPESLNKTSAIDDTNKDIPFLYNSLTESETDELLKGLIFNIAKNLGDPGTALIMVAWFQSVSFSNCLFSLNKGFPLLFCSGSNGQGKGTICGWLMDLYGMHHNGKTTVAQLKSGVGFGRKAEYYASLPLFIDEIRDDEQCRMWADTFRSYYDRDGRTMGTMGGFGVRTQEVRSCFMFAGEDHFSDPATKERCVTVRVNKLGRELVESYAWVDGRKEELSAIGLKWIKESVTTDKAALKVSIKALDRALIVEAGCSARKSKNWAVVGHFALKLAAQYMPEYDMKTFLFKASTDDSAMQKSETTISQFFEVLESVMSQEGLAKITTEHVMTEGNLLHIWFPHVYRVVQEGCRGKFTFSKHAVLNALKEEPFFVSDAKKIQMGLNGVRRVVITLNLDECTDTLKNISLGVKP